MYDWQKPEIKELLIKKLKMDYRVQRFWRNKFQILGIKVNDLTVRRKIVNLRNQMEKSKLGNCFSTTTNNC